MNVMHYIRRTVAAAALLLATVSTVAPAPVLAKNASMIYTGIVVHVSTDNIKVQDPKTHKTVGFAVAPKFKNVFGGKDNTTYQMSAIKPGQYVKVYYDRKLLGVAHADRIYLLDQNNMRIGRQ
jgi:hypothetical protein